MLAALLGQGISPEDAMKLGVYLHGFVGDYLASERVK
jgi:NAD(P)H-hydrate repair Nnr-like enzyme with NAD(P)H-hydrate dehydratase domain